MIIIDGLLTLAFLVLVIGSQQLDVRSNGDEAPTARAVVVTLLFATFATLAYHTVMDVLALTGVKL